MKNLASLLLLVLAGCTTSRVVSSWTAPEAGKAVYKKILVISHLPGADTTARRQMEEHVVKGFRSIGYNAVSYLQTFHEKNFGRLHYDSMRVRFQQQEIDGIITINLLAKEKEAIYVPAKPVIATETLRQIGFGDLNARNASGQSGYYVSSTQLLWESNFYDVISHSLLYRVKSTSFDPTSLEKLAQNFGKQIVNDLQKNDILVKK
jgi:hypothetical protein